MTTSEFFDIIVGNFGGVFMAKLTSNDVIKELYSKHNHSWYTELYNRNKNNLDDIALLYE